LPARMALPILRIRNSHSPAPVTPLLGRGNLLIKIQLLGRTDTPRERCRLSEGISS
jgi:hypothetical protein